MSFSLYGRFRQLEKVRVDKDALSGYLGATNADGVLRTGAPLTYTDGGNYITLDIDETAVDHDVLANTHANPYKLDDLATPDDNTDLDFSTSLHGLVPKGTNTGTYLKDDGTWSAVDPDGENFILAGQVFS